jgi:hypothetical protein
MVDEAGNLEIPTTRLYVQIDPMNPGDVEREGPLKFRDGGVVLALPKKHISKLSARHRTQSNARQIHPQSGKKGTPSRLLMVLEPGR